MANSKIKLIKCLLKQFCDDTCNAIESDGESLLVLEKIFDIIAAQSGLKINYDKTEILRLGLLRNIDFKIITSVAVCEYANGQTYPVWHTDSAPTWMTFTL